MDTKPDGRLEVSTYYYTSSTSMRRHPLCENSLVHLRCTFAASCSDATPSFVNLLIHVIRESSPIAHFDAMPDAGDLTFKARAGPFKSEQDTPYAMAI